MGRRISISLACFRILSCWNKCCVYCNIIPVYHEKICLYQGLVSSSCSTSGSRCVNLVANPVISHEWGQVQKLLTTSGTYRWTFVTQIFHNSQPSHGDERKTFEMMPYELPPTSNPLCSIFIVSSNRQSRKHDIIHNYYWILQLILMYWLLKLIVSPLLPIVTLADFGRLVEILWFWMLLMTLRQIVFPIVWLWACRVKVTIECVQGEGYYRRREGWSLQ